MPWWEVARIPLVGEGQGGFWCIRQSWEILTSERSLVQVMHTVHTGLLSGWRLPLSLASVASRQFGDHDSMVLRFAQVVLCNGALRREIAVELT